MFRAFATISADTVLVLSYRIIVLCVELLSSISTVFFLFIRLWKPWSHKIEDLSIDEYWDVTKEETEDTIESSISSIIQNDSGGEVSTHNDVYYRNWIRIHQRLENFLMLKATQVSREIHLGGKTNNAVTNSKFFVHVLIPCYSESLDIVSQTCLAALFLDFPRDRFNVYICDDGNDLEKKSWVEMTASSIPNVRYVSRESFNRKHGKSGNLNNALTEFIYRRNLSDGINIPREDVVAILDADMICLPNFLSSLLPFLSRDKSVALVQSPQTFHNALPSADFFDVHNVNFFHYLLPAMDAWECTTCCGTNFVVRARDLQKVGWFPTDSVTEDLLLAIKLWSEGRKVRYFEETVVIGEAPKDLRQVFQQRSRWAKGTIQVCLMQNPLFNSKLKWAARISFFCCFWSYMSSAFFNPLFVIVNLNAIVFGLFPIHQIGYVATLFCVAYYTTLFIAVTFTPVPLKHFKSLWVIGKLGHAFSFLALKAFIGVLKSFCCSTRIIFKATQKKGIQNKNSEAEKHRRDSSLSDIYSHSIICILIMGTIAFGLASFSQMRMQDGIDINDTSHPTFQKRNIKFFLIIWMFQFLIAYALPIVYSYLPENTLLQSKALNYLMSVDILISLCLLGIPFVLFKTNLLRAYPDVASAFDVSPSSSSIWIIDDDSQSKLGQYIYDSALDSSIPVIVIQQRPSCILSYVNCLGTGRETWSSYSNALTVIARTIKEKDYPTVVVFEPGWIEEAFAVNGTLSYRRQNDFQLNNLRFGQWTQSSSNFMLNVERFSRLLGTFSRFSSILPQKTLLYLDVGNPNFLEMTQGIPLEFMAQSNALKQANFRGISLNTGNFYASDDVTMKGEELFSKYGHHFVEDSSRNGGAFSNRNWAEIYACTKDPPHVKEGFLPTWDTSGTGKDGNLWINRIGFSDGRMFPKGEYHECLRDHSIECSDQCPASSALSDTRIYRRFCRCE